MSSIIKPNILRIMGLIGGLLSGAFTIFSTGDVVTGAGLIAASLSAAGLKRAD